MLQLRGENEQFSSLPSLRALDHPRLSIITTDRPDSSQLVELHVYVVPKNVWKDGQRLAQNEAMNDAVSAGFVRVTQNTTIRELRKSIDSSCGNENNFPRDYIYLRSVGRCMTKVKTKQEDELRVKNYRPPQTFAPEIYLLEGRQEDYDAHPSVSPAPSSPCEICGTHDGHRANHEKKRSNRNESGANHNDRDPSDYDRNRFTVADQGRSPSRLSQNYHRKPMRIEKKYASTTNGNDLFSQNPLSERQNWTKFTQIGSDREDSSTHLSDAASVGSSNLSKLKQEQERLRRRQAELERMRRAAEDKRAQSQRSDGERSRSDAEDNAAKKIQSSFRGFKDRQDFQERKRNTNRPDRSKKVEEEKKVPTKNQPTLQEFRRRPTLKPSPVIPKHDNPKPSNPKRTKLGSHNNEDENARNEISCSTENRTENIRSFSSSSTNNQRNEKQSNQLYSAKTEQPLGTTSVTIDSPIQLSVNEKSPDNNKDNISTETVIKTPELLNKSPVKTTLDAKPEEKVDNDEIEIERRNAEAKRRRQLDEEEQKKKGKGLDEQRRKDLFKGTRDDPEALRARHQEIRTRRVDLEKVREEVIKHLKNIHNRITLRRKEARDMWKKKYFNEKKKHPPLEERISTMKNELEQIHKKTIQTMEAEAKYAAQMGYTKEAAAGNAIAQKTRMNHEIQEIRHQVEQAKLRLTTDVKLRNQAENECRTLKHELNQARMNLNEIKTRTGP